MADEMPKRRKYLDKQRGGRSTRIVSTRVDLEIYNQLNERAEQENLDLSDLLRMFIRWELNRGFLPKIKLSRRKKSEVLVHIIPESLPPPLPPNDLSIDMEGEKYYASAEIAYLFKPDYGWQSKEHKTLKRRILRYIETQTIKSIVGKNRQGIPCHVVPESEVERLRKMLKLKP